MSSKTKWDAARFQIGQRVKVTGYLERFPDFIVDTGPSGVLGTITSVCKENVWIRLDDHVPGAEEYNNEVCLMDEFPEELDYVEICEAKEVSDE